METRKILAILVLAFGLIVCQAKVSEAGPIGTAITYQGRLIDANDVADGLYDFSFKLYDANVGGSKAANDVNVGEVDVIDGYFTVELDFGSSVFDGNERWLEIGVRPGEMNDPNTHTVLSPRQELMATPYALYATAAGGDGDWQISGNDMYSIPSGNVGVGTTDPTAKLDVVGDVKISGPITRAGNTVWDAGNDGILSGLDADLLDGHDSAAFASASHDHFGEEWSGSGSYGLKINNSFAGCDAVYGYASASSGMSYGVVGVTDSPAGVGVCGYASPDSGLTIGVYGAVSSPDGDAGYFLGNVTVTGNLSKGSGSFKIDHPLDPKNKYLQHSFVESPDMMNIYNGNVTLDKNGQATVQLPEYFKALNRDFRYQLTCIGGFAPVYIAEKISENRFRIAGGKAGMEVSWQVTGIRHDPYAEVNRIVVEENKSAEERGRYLHPAAYGLPEERGIETVRNVQVSETRVVARKAGEL